ETQVWQALVAGDGRADERLLSEEFVGVYPTGFANRSDHVRQLDDGPTMSDFALSEERLLRLSESAVLLCYRADYRRSGDPPSSTSDVMYISSLWCRREGRWLNVFSQDTPASVRPG